MDLVQQLERDWKRNQLICKGDHIIVGVSGGADSVCLLAVLSEVRIRWDLTIMAVHVNHSIRKETAVRDADFVKQLCEKLGISCQVETVDVPQKRMGFPWKKREGLPGMIHLSGLDGSVGRIKLRLHIIWMIMRKQFCSS